MSEPAKRKSPGRSSGTGAQIRDKLNCSKPAASSAPVNFPERVRAWRLQADADEAAGRPVDDAAYLTLCLESQAFKKTYGIGLFEPVIAQLAGRHLKPPVTLAGLKRFAVASLRHERTGYEAHSICAGPGKGQTCAEYFAKLEAAKRGGAK